ncbi:universal stress protein [Aquicoccus porphyridii]|uniref:Universal stress protein n=1 Tax=Aquicoccus porphyridii TaxID=1852029 RepID=A0A5A9ZHA4_9RHOB|nr:universal stress protein [Aquicoccus porphyridii]KAA0916594.1 universal stress protein [Aquicoccus porphyridii]RAI53729.1 universal stress protein [Rhodobacteraceae bacterium AsT-22]
MFSRIMVPVDLAHLPDLERALTCAADLAKHYGAKVTYVGVTAAAPGTLGHNPKEYEAKLSDFAQEQARSRGIDTHEYTVVSHDPATDLDEKLMGAIGETGADLVVMQSHMPNVMDYIWPSNGGKIAEHAKCSVMVVRG